MEKAPKTIRKKTEVRKLQKAFLSERPRRLDIAFMLQDWDDAYNVGGMFRVADAVGAGELILTGKTPAPPHPQISVTSLGQHRRVKWRHYPRHDDGLAAARAHGYTLVAVEIAEGAVDYMEFTYPPKTCLVLGNEEKGVYPGVMEQVDAAVFIPMYGKGRSLNVHVAAAVVGFEALLRGGT